MKLYNAKITLSLMIGSEDEEEAIDFTDQMMQEFAGCYPLDISITEVKKESQLPEGASRKDMLYNFDGTIGDALGLNDDKKIKKTIKKKQHKL